MASSATLHIGSQLTGEPDAVAAALARTIEALAGRPCRLTPVGPEDEPRGEAPGTCYLLPVFEGDSAETVGVIALDERAAIDAAAALAMLDDDERAAAAETGVAPQKVRDALPELGRLLTGALAKLVSGAEPPKLRADAVERQSPESWSVVPACAGDGVCHALFAVSFDDTPAGSLLVALRGGGASRSRDDDACPENLDGVTVRLLARPGDPAQVALGELLTSLGGRVSSPHRTHLPASPPAAAFIVSRSPSDLRARMESLIGEGERPPLIVACSDRPTRDLVLSARHSGADDFLVLPTTRKRLLSVLAGALQPA